MQISFLSGTFMDFSPTFGLIVNEGAQDLDFRVESSNNTHALYLNGTNSNVGISTSSPYARLSVVGEIVGEKFTATTTATSTFGGGINSSRQGIFGTGLTLTAGQLTVPKIRLS